MKFVIIGVALTGNKGAAAMLESSIQTLTVKYPNAQFTLLSIRAKLDRKLNTYKNLSILSAKPLRLALLINPLSFVLRFFPFLKGVIGKISPEVIAIAECDVFLDQGGITFSDGREVFIIYNVATVLPPLFLGKKIVKCAQAIGPFNNPINHFFAKIILPKMALIVSRGAQTHKHLESLSLTNIVRGADYAFALELVDIEVEEVQKYLGHRVFVSKTRGKKGVIGICPSVVVKNKCDKKGIDYMQVMSQFIKYLTQSGYSVLLVPHSVRPGTTKTHNNDLPLTKELYAMLLEKQEVLFIDEELSSQELRYLIGRCDLFIAARFHSMISSLAMGVPTLVTGWSHKYVEVLAMFDLEKYVFSFDKLTLEYLSKRVEELRNDSPEIKAKIAKHLPAVKKIAQKHVEYIDAVLIKDYK